MLCNSNKILTHYQVSGGIPPVSGKKGDREPFPVSFGITP